jgi:hypothetical protein
MLLGPGLVPGFAFPKKGRWPKPTPTRLSSASVRINEIKARFGKLTALA